MKKIIVIFQLFFIFSLFWVFWTPGIKVASDFHTASAADLAGNIYPYTWKDDIAAIGLGEYSVPVLWSQPFHAFFGVLSYLGLPFEFVQKSLGFLCLTLGFISIRKLLNFFELGEWGKMVGALLFLTNTFFVLLFDGGQLSLALGYSILPFAVYYFFKIIEKDYVGYAIKFSFWCVLLSIFDIRILYIIGIIFILYLLYTILFLKEKISVKKLLSICIMPVIFLIGVHAYWLLPAIFSKAPQLPQSYEKASQVDFLSFSKLIHSMLLLQPHWYENVFGRVSSPKALFILIPVLVVMSLLIKKNKFIGFWMLIALLGVFLSKGSNEPLSFVYTALFTYIPGFSLFRDPVKFYFLSSLAFTILIAFTTDKIISPRSKLIALTIVFYLVWLIKPVFLGQMNGLLSYPLYTNEYTQLKKEVISHNDPSIIFWIPTKAPQGFTSNLYPSLDGARIGQKRPFLVGSKGSYETLNFLREASYMGQIFDIAGIGYIAYPLLDPRKDDMHPDSVKYHSIFTDQLSKLPWLKKLDSFVSLFKTKSHQQKFFVTPNTWWVIGSDDIYKESTKSASLNLSKNAFIFVQENTNLGKRIDSLPQAKIVLNKKSLIDLSASFIESSDLIFPAKLLTHQPDKVSGWWKRETSDFISWREFLETKYKITNQDFDLGGGWAVGEGNLKLKIKNEKLKNKDVLLVRAMESSRSGNLKFFQDGQIIGSLETKSNKDANVRWFEIGVLKKDGELDIESNGDINVMNALGVLDAQKWKDYKEKAAGLTDRVMDFEEKNATASAQEIVSIRKINPTKYVVDVSNVSQASMLVFSQNYDSLWKVNGQSPILVYSFLNGFRIDKSGEYIVEFDAQKYVLPGLIVAILSGSILFLLLLRYSKEK